MDNQLDKDLKNRIGRVFDDFEAPEAEANAGWAALRERYPARRNRAAWWWSSAAAVLLLIGLGIWLMYQPEQPKGNQMVKAKPAVINEVKSDSAAWPPSINSNNTAPVLADASRPAVPLYNPVKVPPVSYTDPIFVSPPDTGGASAATAAMLAVTKPTITAVSDSIDTQNSSLTNSSIALAKVETDAINSNTQKLPTGMDGVFTREAEAKAAKGLATEPVASEGTKRLALSVYAGTYLNYAKGSNNQINAGAGITSDIRLLKKVSLVTGVAIAQNKLKYNSEPAQGNVYAAAMSAATNNAEITDLGATAFFAGISSNARTTTQLGSYDASFTGLDIPLNLKYEFSPGKSDSYILAGVSSGTFINETYRYNYSTSLLPTVNQTAETQARFSTFDFARTLNVAFGVGTSVGKRNRLIIEPFLKYPLSGLGSQQIKFGASGVNLKFKFLGRKQR